MPRTLHLIILFLVLSMGWTKGVKKNHKLQESDIIQITVGDRGTSRAISNDMTKSPSPPEPDSLPNQTRLNLDDEDDVVPVEHAPIDKITKVNGTTNNSKDINKENMMDQMEAPAGVKGTSVVYEGTGNKKEDNGTSELELCENSGKGRLQYVWGDALGVTKCLGPNKQEYPWDVVNQMFENKWKWRHKRAANDPFYTKNLLLDGWMEANGYPRPNGRMMDMSENDVQQKSRCPGQAKKLCKSYYDTTAPLFGLSMTTGQPVAIVQKFPDLLQQVIYEVCMSDECEVVHGKCTNTYVPYLFMTIPWGPVTLTGQDYILVESGCSCSPKL